MIIIIIKFLMLKACKRKMSTATHRFHSSGLREVLGGFFKKLLGISLASLFKLKQFILLCDLNGICLGSLLGSLAVAENVAIGNNFYESQSLPSKVSEEHQETNLTAAFDSKMIFLSGSWRQKELKSPKGRGSTIWEVRSISLSRNEQV